MPESAVQLTDTAMDALIDEYCRWGARGREVAVLLFDQSDGLVYTC